LLPSLFGGGVLAPMFRWGVKLLSLWLFVGLAQRVTNGFGNGRECSAVAAQTPPVVEGQPQMAESISPPSGDGLSEEEAKSRWESLYGRWKEILDQLQRLRWDYRLVSPARAREIEQEWEKLLAAGRELEPQLIEAAYQLFRHDPRRYFEEGQFLLAVVATWYDQDNFEPAYDLADRLIAAGHPNPAVYALAGVAAFVLHEYDRAEELLRIAEKRGSLSEGGQKMLRDLEYYRQAWERERVLREKEAKADDLPRVLLITTQGDIEVELFENEAPNTVANFISLVEKGFYNGVPFHRVVPHFVAQTGDPTGTGMGGPGYRIACECYRPEHRLHFRGSLSMAHAGRDTGGSQFFICLMPQRHLDGKHTVFGRVVRGMEVLAKIKRRDPDDPAPPEPDRILEARVLRKRPHPYEPVTLPLR
jgi:cyclophilin family peptidyl-prolyl cis-trans isomerase